MFQVAPATQRRLNELRAAWRALPKDLKNEIRKAQRAELNPIWRAAMSESLAAHQSTPLHAVVFRTGTRVQAGLPLSLIAGGGARRVSGGASLDDLDTMVEFGTKRRERLTRYNRRARGKGSGTPVVRHAARQLPPYKANGWVVYPAAAVAIPRIIGSWIGHITDRIERAIDGEV